MGIIEKGPWKIFEDNKKIGIISEDFSHDAILWIDGDFKDYYQKREYALEISKRLNSYKIEYEIVDINDCIVSSMIKEEKIHLKIIHTPTGITVEGITRSEKSAEDKLTKKLLKQIYDLTEKNEKPKS